MIISKYGTIRGSYRCRIMTTKRRIVLTKDPGQVHFGVDYEDNCIYAAYTPKPGENDLDAENHIDDKINDLNMALQSLSLAGETEGVVCGQILLPERIDHAGGDSDFPQKDRT